MTNRLVSTWMLACALGAALPAGAWPATAQKASDAVAADLEMALASRPFRQLADEFVARAARGDVAGTQALLSRQLVERTGEAGVRQALEAQILPFFQQGREAAPKVTVTITTDASGQQGYAFYMWMVPRDANAARRPFTVYVVREQDRLAVANVVPDRLVPGRHP